MERHRSVITIGDILQPEHVDLELTADSKQHAIQKVSGILRNDPRVGNWSHFNRRIIENDGGTLLTGELGICIPHLRSDEISEMVMALGRCGAGLPNQGGGPIHYIFVIGIPQTLAADYLRILGALMRIFRQPEVESDLRTIETPAAFIRRLREAEMRL